ncbi:MAG: NFACT RNA binding domain-containing protein [archaeon]
MATKFREFITRNGTTVLAGKNAQNNESLIEQAEDNEELFHTVAAGSPFVNIKDKPKKGDIKEAAVFCARYSRDWKKNKEDVEIHRFKKKDVYKEKSMALGTFGIKKFKKIKVTEEDIKNWLQ